MKRQSQAYVLTIEETSDGTEVVACNSSGKEEGRKKGNTGLRAESKCDRQSHTTIEVIE